MSLQLIIRAEAESDITDARPDGIVILRVLHGARDDRAWRGDLLQR